MTDKKDVAKVRKDNALINGKYRFNLHEQKILLIALSQVQYGDEDFRPYQIPWVDIKRLTGGHVDSSKKMNVICEGLKNKTVYVKNKDSITGFGMISRWTIKHGSAVELVIDPNMRDFLLQLTDKGNFTIYDLECILPLKSTHSIRLYEILKSHLWQGSATLTLDSLKWSLDVSENASYNDFGNFRNRILDRAQNDFEKHTDIVFVYKTIKEGRQVVSLHFQIANNPNWYPSVDPETGRAVYSKKSPQKATTKKTVLKVGDIVSYEGNEYEVYSGGILTDEGAVPIGRIIQLVDSGRIKIIKRVKK